MKFCVISDTHNRLNTVTIPECDILIHAGDMTGRGYVWEIEKQCELIGKAPAKHKLITPGNHDFLAQDQPAVFRDICKSHNIIPLINESIVVEGIKMYFSPYSPTFFSWAFMADRGDRIRDIWAMIPDNTEILVTHSPAFGILDQLPDGASVGCKDLLERIRDLKDLRVHVAGHIHHMGGKTQLINGVTHINASIVGEDYKVANKPIVFDFVK